MTVGLPIYKIIRNLNKDNKMITLDLPDELDQYKEQTADQGQEDYHYHLPRPRFAIQNV